MGDASSINIEDVISANNSIPEAIKVKPLHPTFGAEVSGVDFSAPVSDEVFNQIHAAVIKVLPNHIPNVGSHTD